MQAKKLIQGTWCNPEQELQWRSKALSALARNYNVHISSIKRTIKRQEAKAQPQLKLVAA
jgi:hypothetical protein